jgi:protoheme ferro-lyase
MLMSLALNQYFNGGLSNLLFKDTCKYLYNFFKGPSLEHKNLNKWNIILLKMIMDKNTDKLTNNCL